MEALSSPDLPDTARRAQFFNRQREIDHYLTGIDEHLVITQYLTVFNFADTFAFDWYVVGLET